MKGVLLVNLGSPESPTAKPAKARAVLWAAFESKCPCSRSALMIGFARITIAMDEGTVRIVIQRTPDVVQSAKPDLSPARTRRTSSGTKVVAIEMANKPWGSMKNVKALLYASWLPLPGSARFLMKTSEIWFVTTYPKVHEDNLTIVFTAG